MPEALTFSPKHAKIGPCSRGGSGALYLQSAIAGVILRRGLWFSGLPPESGVDIRVSRDGCLRTVSGRERSSTKQNVPGAVRALGLS